MKAIYLSLFSLALLSISASSCNNDDDLAIDERLVPYIDRFSEEATLRGVEFDINDAQIEAYIDELDNLVGGDVLGFCQEPQQRFPLSAIYIDANFWQSATDLQKEYVVFHELGHCFLNRDHVTPVVTDSEGNCVSIMAAGDAPCNGLEAYDTDRRSDLLDELFAN